MSDFAAVDTGPRTKGTSVVRPIVFGSSSRHFGHKRDSDGHTHAWTIYLKPYSPEEDMGAYVKKVQFKLHDSYANPLRVVTKPPFEISETGWGEFEIAIKIFFQDPTEKPVTVYHLLRLFQTNLDPTSLMVGKDTLVSEHYDEIIFHEPTQLLYDLLMSSQRVSSMGPLPSVGVHSPCHTDFDALALRTLKTVLQAKTRVTEEPHQIHLLQDWLKDLTEKIHSASYTLENSRQRSSLVYWYDSVGQDGILDWQNELNQKNFKFFEACDGIYLNYCWRPEHGNLERSSELATEAKRPYDVLVGVDVYGRNCIGNGGFHTNVATQVVHDVDMSLVIFAPAWTYEKKYHSMNFDEMQNRFWGSLEHTLPPIKPFRLRTPSANEANGVLAQAPCILFHTTFCSGTFALYNYNMDNPEAQFEIPLDYGFNIGLVSVAKSNWSPCICGPFNHIEINKQVTCYIRKATVVRHLTHSGGPITMTLNTPCLLISNIPHPPSQCHPALDSDYSLAGWTEVSPQIEFRLFTFDHSSIDWPVVLSIKYLLGPQTTGAGLPAAYSPHLVVNATTCGCSGCLECDTKQCWHKVHRLSVPLSSDSEADASWESSDQDVAQRSYKLRVLKPREVLLTLPETVRQSVVLLTLHPMYVTKIKIFSIQIQSLDKLHNLCGDVLQEPNPVSGMEQSIGTESSIGIGPSSSTNVTIGTGPFIGPEPSTWIAPCFGIARNFPDDPDTYFIDPYPLLSTSSRMRSSGNESLASMCSTFGSNMSHIVLSPDCDKILAMTTAHKVVLKMEFSGTELETRLPVIYLPI